VKDVVVGGKQAIPSPSAKGVFIAEIDVQPEGETAVEVLVRLENGCEYSKVKRYARQPLAGLQYHFPVGGEVGELVLLYQPRGISTGEFLHTPRDASLQIVEAFRRSRAGKKFAQESTGLSPSPRSAGSGVSWLEASRIGTWLTEELRKTGWLGRDHVVELPTLLQVKAIHATTPPTTSHAASRDREWLSGQEDHVDGFPASLAEGGARLLGADDRDDLAAFQLIVPFEGEGNRLVPKNAAPRGKGQAERKERRESNK
jgi:hypothetical protein